MSPTTHMSAESGDRFPIDCNGLRLWQIHALFPNLSYRMLDYWRGNGRITTHQHAFGVREPITDPANWHSGNVACWPPDQVALLGRFNALQEWGFTGQRMINLATNRHEVARLIRTLVSIETDLLDAEARLFEELKAPL
jgi:hypothetical protein